MAFDNYSSPNLPAPPNTYSRAYFMQLVRALGTFFKISDSRAGMTIDSVTTKILRLSVAQFVGVNGANNNLSLASASFIRISTPTANFSITGMAGGLDGRMLVLFNSTTYNMTIANASVSSLPANRILTGTGADIVTVGQGAVTLIYSVNDFRWIVTSLQA